MKIHLHVKLCGRLGVRDPGQHDVTEEEGKALIAGGYAHEVTDITPETAVAAPDETAMLPHAAAD